MSLLARTEKLETNLADIFGLGHFLTYDRFLVPAHLSSILIPEADACLTLLRVGHWTDLASLPGRQRNTV